MTDKIKTHELDEAALDQVIGGTKCQNNIKQFAIAAHGSSASGGTSHTGGINVILADGSVRAFK